MKRAILLLALAFSCSGLFAQWSDSASVNKCLIPESLYSCEPMPLSDGTFYVFADRPDGSVDTIVPYLYHFDKDGNDVWGGPIEITRTLTATWTKTMSHLLVDDEDNAVIVVQNMKSGVTESYTAYKISPEGEFLWPEGGVDLHNGTIPDDQYCAAVQLTQLSDGSYLFTWMADEIMMQRVSRDGQVQWGEGKSFGSGAYPYAFDAEDGDLLMIYQSSGIMARRLDFEGNDVWPEPVPVFSGELNGNIPLWTYIKVVPMSDGVLVGYYAFEGDFHYPAISYLKFDGTHAFAEADQGLRLAYNDNFGFAPVFDVDEENQVIYAAWVEYRGGQSYKGLTCQKISMNGELLWNPEGNVLMPIEQRPVSYQTVSVGPKGVVMVGAMEQYDIDNNGLGENDPVNIHAFLLDANGEYVWNTPSVTICDTVSVKHELMCLPYSDDQWIFLWEDCRREGGVDGGYIFGQNIGLDGTMGEIETTPSANEGLAKATAFQVRPNPIRDNATLLIDNPGSRSQNIRVELVALNGSVVEIVYQGSLSQGQNRIEWARPSGIQIGFYILKATMGDKTQFAKVILQ